ncbi:MotA/TolQ/ExbB proton channel family protein [Mameliella alba]|nr:hypothetical protein CDZ95_13980 [Mameliella alba]OWV46809.1 hypothetical protein CDZ96_17480 [Mameliella alba]OWV63459.1 hypothetical protein CDZ97_15460 [Mameliella alba]PTR37728.1 MotA/TolQ/ExbB proton channel family protein [Mameliella alba]SDD62505.1 MotA/TolQ/ExbB proton channel family protein [Mameliella alba]
MFERTYEESRRRAKSTFDKRLQKYLRANSLFFAIPAIAVSWIFALFLLFFLTAYRPEAATGLQIEWLTKQVDVQPASEQGETKAQYVVMRNRNAALSFREYAGRTVGAIPPACAITDGELPIPKPDAKPGQPMLIAAFGWDPDTPGPGASSGEKPTYVPCKWRDHPMSFMAAISPDVGPVQKFTLLLLIIAMGILRRNRLFRRIESESWPEVDEYNVDLNFRLSEDENGFEQRDPRVAQHPISFIVQGDNRNSSEPIYPTNLLRLDPFTVENSKTARFNATVSSVRDKLLGATRNRKLVGPLDLILDVLKAGAHTGRVGDAEKRMRVAVYEYGNDLSDRLETGHYLMWLMPTVGFLGTIYGISASLVRAKGLFSGSADGEASEFEEKIQLVVDGLGVAFDTTSMALLCSALLYWALVRSESGVREVVDKARRSLSNLLIDRMVDRDMRDVPYALVNTPGPAPEQQFFDQNGE